MNQFFLQIWEKGKENLWKIVTITTIFAVLFGFEISRLQNNQISLGNFFSELIFIILLLGSFWKTLFIKDLWRKWTFFTIILAFSALFPLVREFFLALFGFEPPTGENAKITLVNFYTGIAAITATFFVVWRAFLKDIDTKNQTKTVENDSFTRKNQQFLDAIRLFGENGNIEVKKAALFHLENLALSSPDHRQRVLDFLNSLNRWMTSDEQILQKLKEKTDEEWEKWRNERRKFKDLGIEDEKQMLSMETSKIFENIIKKHSNDWKEFKTEEERSKYSLDFSYFIFLVIDFSSIIDLSGLTFPQKETSFHGCIFFGIANFNMSKFLGVANFKESTFTGSVGFIWSTFSDLAIFEESKFFLNVDFTWSKFLGVANFKRNNFSDMAIFDFAVFSRQAYFAESTFSSSLTGFKSSNFSAMADFEKVKFQGIVDFEKSKFSEFVDFSNADFDGCDLHELTKKVFFSSKTKDAKFRFLQKYDRVPNWNTILLNSYQEKYFFSLDDAGEPTTDEEKERWKIWKEHEQERNEYRKSLKDAE